MTSKDCKQQGYLYYSETIVPDNLTNNRTDNRTDNLTNNRRLLNCDNRRIETRQLLITGLHSQ